MKTAAILVMVASAASSHANALSAREAAELQALCDLNPQATGTTRSICDAWMVAKTHAASHGNAI
jgi:hypothetical protein